MLVTIKTRDLINQLPKQLRYDLIASFDALPETLTFMTAVPTEAAEKRKVFGGTSEKEAKSIADKYPKLAEVLSISQWRFFCLIQRPKGAMISELKACIKGFEVSDNLIASHMVALRRSFKKHSLPFTVESIRATGLFPEGRYILRSL